MSSSSQAICFDGTSIFVGGGGESQASSDFYRFVLKANVSGLGIEGGAIPVLGIVKALAFDGTYVYAASELTAPNEDGTANVVVNGNVTRFQ